MYQPTTNDDHSGNPSALDAVLDAADFGWAVHDAMKVPGLADLPAVGVLQPLTTAGKAASVVQAFQQDGFEGGVVRGVDMGIDALVGQGIVGVAGVGANAAFAGGYLAGKYIAPPLNRAIGGYVDERSTFEQQYAQYGVDPVSEDYAAAMALPWALEQLAQGYDKGKAFVGEKIASGITELHGVVTPVVNHMAHSLHDTAMSAADTQWAALETAKSQLPEHQHHLLDDLEAGAVHRAAMAQAAGAVGRMTDTAPDPTQAPAQNSAAGKGESAPTTEPLILPTGGHAVSVAPRVGGSHITKTKGTQFGVYVSYGTAGLAAGVSVTFPVISPVVLGLGALGLGAVCLVNSILARGDKKRNKLLDETRQAVNVAQTHYNEVLIAQCQQSLAAKDVTALRQRGQDIDRGLGDYQRHLDGVKQDLGAKQKKGLDKKAYAQAIRFCDDMIRTAQQTQAAMRFSHIPFVDLQSQITSRNPAVFAHKEGVLYRLTLEYNDAVSRNDIERARSVCNAALLLSPGHAEFSAAQTALQSTVAPVVTQPLEAPSVTHTSCAVVAPKAEPAPPAATSTDHDVTEAEVMVHPVPLAEVELKEDEVPGLADAAGDEAELDVSGTESSQETEGAVTSPSLPPGYRLAVAAEVCKTIKDSAACACAAVNMAGSIEACVAARNSSTRPMSYARPVDDRRLWNHTRLFYGSGGRRVRANAPSGMFVGF